MIGIEGIVLIVSAIACSYVLSVEWNNNRFLLFLLKLIMFAALGLVIAFLKVRPMGNSTRMVIFLVGVIGLIWSANHARKWK